MIEAKIYKKLKDKIVCQLCWRFCKIDDGEAGFCQVRFNKGGKLYTTTYGKLSVLESRPIEIKPFFHFKPGTTSMTFSTYSCNFTCPWCQNWSISKYLPPNDPVVEPEEVVDKALKYGDISVCASLNEPTLLFEYLLEVFSIARSRGLLNTMVSNGYVSPLALDALRKAGLDAMNVDVKGNDEVYREYCDARVDFVWRTIKRALKLGIHIEVVSLLVTNVSDEEDVVRDIVENHLKYAGADVPIHFTRYFPAFTFKEPPTKIEKLEKAISIAKKEGINFVYIGNVPGHKFENTYCPECGELLVRRYSYRVLDFKIKEGKCCNCGRELYGIW